MLIIINGKNIIYVYITYGLGAYYLFLYSKGF